MSSSSPILHPILSQRNKHPRDLNIQFEEEGHKYTILSDPNSKYTSVTTWNHSHFPHFDADVIIGKMMTGKSWKEGHKYWGLAANQIKDLWNCNRDNAAGAGTSLHFEIECFMNSKVLMFDYTHLELWQQYNILAKYDHTLRSKEWNYFIQFIQDNPKLKPYRTEWIIYHEELKLAGSIDMVYENEDDGSLSIYDWKRSKEISSLNAFKKCAITPCIEQMPDSNYWHYALQLNTYKAILELKYNRNVRDLYLVRLHPDNEGETYELIKLPDLSKVVFELFEIRRKNLRITY
jgi:hypothetical protein